MMPNDWTPEMFKAYLESLPPKERTEFLNLLSKTPAFVDPDFPEQSDFVLDPWRFLLLFGTRRSGKSFAIGRRLLLTMWRKPNSVVLYVGLTEKEAKKILWDPVIKRLNNELQLGMVPNESEARWTMPNGSVLYFVGLNASEKQKDKIYGTALDGVAVDEAALYRIDLQEFIYSVILPALMDHQGWLCLSGMPSAYHGSFFYLLTQVWAGGVFGEGESESQDASRPGTWTIFDGKRITWRGHRWAALQNPTMHDQVKKEIDEAIAANPAVVNDPVFIAGMLGRWAIDPALLVIKYTVTKNTIAELPKGGNWRKILGLDLGWDDPSAWALNFYRDRDPNLYVVEAGKGSFMDLVDVQVNVQRLESKWGEFDLKVVDGANKQSVETLRRRMRLNLRASPKGEKWEHLQMMSADFAEGFVKLLPAAAALSGELTKLVRDPNSDLPQVLPGLPDHCTDAQLYAWRSCHNYLWRPTKEPPPLPEFGTDAWAEADKQARFREIEGDHRQMPDY